MSKEDMRNKTRLGDVMFPTFRDQNPVPLDTEWTGFWSPKVGNMTSSLLQRTRNVYSVKTELFHLRAHLNLKSLMNGTRLLLILNSQPILLTNFQSFLTDTTTDTTTSEAFNLHEVSLFFQKNLGKVELEKLSDPCQVGEWVPSGQAVQILMIYFPTPEQEVSKHKFFGKTPGTILPIKPSDEECTYDIDKTFTKPTEDILQPLDAATPPRGETQFPQLPDWRLCQDPRWSCGWVYCASYRLEDLRMDENRMAAIVTPPNAESTRTLDGRCISSPIPGMVKMVPGVPFIYFLNSDTSRPYTLSCIQTLASLCPYHDFPEILDASVRLAKLTWGCDSNVPPICPLGHLEGLKRNDCSKSIAPDLPPGLHDGSYSLAMTVLKGTGQGTVIPATQVNTEEGGPQIAAVLKMLNELHKRIMPKCISRFEYEVAKFHSEDMNVVGFGGLEPNGTGCQFNLSSLCSHLSKRLGHMGSWHPDSKDDHTRYTLFVLLLKIGPSKHRFYPLF